MQFLLIFSTKNMLLGKGEGGSKNPKNVLTYVIYEWSQAFQKNEKQGIETRFSI